MDQRIDSGERALSVGEVAKRSGLKVSTIYDYAAEGLITSWRIEASWPGRMRIVYGGRSLHQYMFHHPGDIRAPNVTVFLFLFLLQCIAKRRR